MTTLLPPRRLERTGDAELVRMTRKGDADAYATLFRRHASAAASVARSVTTAFEPDDLVSEAYTRILQALQAGKGPTGAFRPYLFTTVRNIAASWGRSGKHAVPLDPEELDTIAFAEDDPLAALDRSLTAQAFRALPERWQEALWYSEVEGMQPAELAPLLGLRASAAAALCYRAREGLRQAWIQAHLSSTSLEPECRWTVERLPALARGRLGKRDRSRVDAHLKTCAKCRMAAAEAREAGNRLVLVLLPLAIGTGAATAYLAAAKAGVAGATVAAAGAGAAGLAGGTSAAGTSGSAATSAAGSSGSAGAAAASAAGGSGIFSGATGVVMGIAAAVVVAGAAVAGVLVVNSPGHETDAASRSLNGSASDGSGTGGSGTGGSGSHGSGGPASGSSRSGDPDSSDTGSSAPGSPTVEAPVHTQSNVSTDAGAPVPASDTEPSTPPATPPSTPPDTSPGTPPDTPPDSGGGDGSPDPPATPPAAPTVTVDTGGGLYFPIVSGTAEPHATVTVSVTGAADAVGGTTTATVTADTSGSWSIDTAFSGLGAGEGTVTATQTDADGHVSAPASASFTLGSPQFTVTVVDLVSTTLNVTGAPNSTVQVLVGGAAWRTVSLDADGRGSTSVLSLFVYGNTYSVGVQYIDDAGRAGPVTESTVTVGE
jgi:RNA polymerase sigma factor (sigma-70 family)